MPTVGASLIACSETFESQALITLLVHGMDQLIWLITKKSGQMAAFEVDSDLNIFIGMLVRLA